MAGETHDDLSCARSPRGAPNEQASKRGSTGAHPVRFNVRETEETAEPTAACRPHEIRGSGTGRGSAGVFTEQSGQLETSSASSKPHVSLGPNGQPISILKGRRQFGYAQACRLAEQLRVKFAVDKNETRFYCPDSNEHMEPPPAPAELRGAVRGFLKSSKKAVQESQDITQAAQRQLDETKRIEEELAAITDVYVQKLEKRRQEAQKAKQSQMVVVAKAKPQRRILCCGGAPLVLP